VRHLLGLSLGLASVTLVMVLAVVFLGGTSSSDTTYRGSHPPDGYSLPPFALRDENGIEVRSDALHGKVVLLTFLDTQCTDACPIVAGLIARSLDDLSDEKRADVVALGISVDPDEDNRASVDRFLEQHDARGRLHYLTSPVAVMEPIWGAFAVVPTLATGDDSLHSIPVEIYDRAGAWRSTLNVGADLTQRNLVHDLGVALRS
jgi:cytochrome oxidase Cu insertion factor (SCO1/SenC/PrrC family)